MIRAHTLKASRQIRENRLSHGGPVRPVGREARPAPLVPKALGEMLYSKKPAKSSKHMGLIAGIGCLICHQPALVHHVDICTPKNMGPKVSDYITAPLCPGHHTDLPADSAHGGKVEGGERGFWKMHQIDIGAWIIATLREFYSGANKHALAAIEAIETQRAQERA